MANSTISLQSLVDDASSMGDIAPALATGGFSVQPALTIANDVLNAMLLGGPDGQPMNWKWNRFFPRPFPTISLQQDYFVPGVSNLSWIESAFALDINNTSNPKPKRAVEVHKDLMPTDEQTGYPGKVCWIPNDQCLTGTWGAVPLGPTATNPAGGSGVSTSLTGSQNPGPNVIYTNPVGITTQPTNPITIITDPNGHFWVVTTYGTCGSTQPVWPTTPAYPTFQSPSTVATTVTDGSVVWTAIDPSGQGFRLSPLPPITGTTWLIQCIGQKRPIRFTSLAQTLDPIPDDYEKYFKMGFFAQCYRRHPDAKVRQRFGEEWQLFLRDLDMAVRQGNREMDDFGFYPGVSIMDSGWAINPINPAMPYGPWQSQFNKAGTEAPKQLLEPACPRCNALVQKAETLETLMKFLSRLKRVYFHTIAIPVLLIVLGSASNQAVLIANHGTFPVQVNAEDILTHSDNPVLLKDGTIMLDNVHCVMTEKTHLNWLADIFNMHRAIMSIGDFLIDFGDRLWGFAPIVWGTLVVRKLWEEAEAKK